MEHLVLVYNLMYVNPVWSKEGQPFIPQWLVKFLTGREEVWGSFSAFLGCQLRLQCWALCKFSKHGDRRW